ncbi:efflux RND transporter periplasmic adaptor subunit [Paenibacillus sp. SC116]|uniref:efflux RND transporter periplasmic adaptor subunit n=1 Tax=Paenibacillus sp. SC116 TaxID=2968986 RepID=UPI00215A24D0|nr:efflux RND transporter periplasmic adaptor subunit [Paenibacillus sp. SC116]MCR8844517.1 efflux RND transporter periplasmic adaptor subunit [Paenibacillus sp. SC116]
MDASASAEEHSIQKRKKTLRSLLIGSTIALLIVTLYSNTLRTMDLPKVWAEVGRQGQLAQEFSAIGTLRPVSEIELSSSAGWTVKSVAIKAGDRVKGGQTLVTYENPDADNQLRDEQAMLAQVKLQLEVPQESYVEAVRNDDEASMRTSKRDMKLAQLQIDAQERKIQNAQQNMRRYSTIVAPFDGVVTQLNAVKGAASGNEGFDVRLSNVSLGYQAELSLPAAATEQLKIGDKLDLQSYGGGATRPLNGTITIIEHVDARAPSSPSQSVGEVETGIQQPVDAVAWNRLVVKISDQTVRTGEQVRVNVTVISGEGGGMLLSNKAIHKEGASHYVHVVEEAKGPLGNTYHIRKTKVEVGAANDSETVILSGAYINEQIVVESTEPLVEGSRVRPQ